ncbi:MAG TPA: PorV/PorQ family protein [Candidatus Kapabacteria bacterium]
MRFRALTLFLLLAALLFVAMPLRAQTIEDYAGEFLELGVGARSLALGGAGAAISEDATAGYWNPAGLNMIKFPSVTAMHETRFDGTVSYDYGAFATPLSANSSAALSILHIAVNNILDTRNALVDLNNNGQLDPGEYLNYDNVTTFSNYDWVAILSYAKEIDPELSWGVNAKLIDRRLDLQTTGTGIGFDVGTRYTPNDQLTLAAVAEDITTTLLSYTTGTKELVSPTVILGGAYEWRITADGAHRMMPTADIDLRFENRGQDAMLYVGPISADFHEGIEYRYKDLFAIRGGYNDMQMWSVGAGIIISRLHIDYAYLGANAQDQLGATHRISISFDLQNPKWKRSGE